MKGPQVLGLALLAAALTALAGLPPLEREGVNLLGLAYAEAARLGVVANAFNQELSLQLRFYQPPLPIYLLVACQALVVDEVAALRLMPLLCVAWTAAVLTWALLKLEPARGKVAAGLTLALYLGNPWTLTAAKTPHFQAPLEAAVVTCLVLLVMARREGTRRLNFAAAVALGAAAATHVLSAGLAVVAWLAMVRSLRPDPRRHPMAPPPWLAPLLTSAYVFLILWPGSLWPGAFLATSRVLWQDMTAQAAQRDPGSFVLDWTYDAPVLGALTLGALTWHLGRLGSPREWIWRPVLMFVGLQVLSSAGAMPVPVSPQLDLLAPSCLLVGLALAEGLERWRGEPWAPLARAGALGVCLLAAPWDLARTTGREEAGWPEAAHRLRAREDARGGRLFTDGRLMGWYLDGWMAIDPRGESGSIPPLLAHEVAMGALDYLYIPEGWVYNNPEGQAAMAALAPHVREVEVIHHRRSPVVVGRLYEALRRPVREERALAGAVEAVAGVATDGVWRLPWPGPLPGGGPVEIPAPLDLSPLLRPTTMEAGEILIYELAPERLGLLPRTRMTLRLDGEPAPIVGAFADLDEPGEVMWVDRQRARGVWVAVDAAQPSAWLSQHRVELELEEGLGPAPGAPIDMALRCGGRIGLEMNRVVTGSSRVYHVAHEGELTGLFGWVSAALERDTWLNEQGCLALVWWAPPSPTDQEPPPPALPPQEPPPPAPPLP